MPISQVLVKKIKALGNPIRLDVLDYLCRLDRQKPRHVGGLAKALGLRASVLSHHLQILESARLVAGIREGQQVLYYAQVGPMASLVNYFEELYKALQEKAGE